VSYDLLSTQHRRWCVPRLFSHCMQANNEKDLTALNPLTKLRMLKLSGHAADTRLDWLSLGHHDMVSQITHTLSLRSCYMKTQSSCRQSAQCTLSAAARPDATACSGAGRWLHIDRKVVESLT
jgi:hypothetical protein